jgi:hypothetical protein
MARSLRGRQRGTEGPYYDGCTTGRQPPGCRPLTCGDVVRSEGFEPPTFCSVGAMPPVWGDPGPGLCAGSPARVALLGRVRTEVNETRTETTGSQRPGPIAVVGRLPERLRAHCGPLGGGVGSGGAAAAPADGNGKPPSASRPYRAHRCRNSRARTPRTWAVPTRAR